MGIVCSLLSLVTSYHPQFTLRKLLLASESTAASRSVQPHPSTSLQPTTSNDFYRGGDIDRTTFEQILEMDDDPAEREFSKSIVFDFFQQASETFEKMDKYLEDEDLEQLSALGHFLKGSSATLGLTKVKDSCEKIQHFGARK